MNNDNTPRNKFETTVRIPWSIPEYARDEVQRFHKESWNTFRTELVEDVMQAENAEEGDGEYLLFKRLVAECVKWHRIEETYQSIKDEDPFDFMSSHLIEYNETKVQERVLHIAHAYINYRKERFGFGFEDGV